MLKGLSYNNALRALLCMLPMVAAYFLGATSLIVPLGQGGFFSSTMPVARTKLERLVSMCLMIAPGLGFYLIGGNIADNFIYAMFFAFAIGLVCSLLTGFRYLGMVALAGFIPIFTAGLNAGDPVRASESFMAFAFVIIYCGMISLLPFWQKIKNPPAPAIEEADRAIMGVKMGVGLAVSLGISMFFNFGKLGWAPSAVGSVIRTDNVTGKKRAWARAIAVIGGAMIASIGLALLPNIQILMLVVLILSVINGLTAFTKLGQLPLFYNAVILLLYSYTSSTPTGELINTRIMYNLLGIMIALAIVYYPLPRISKEIKNYYLELAKK